MVEFNFYDQHENEFNEVLNLSHFKTHCHITKFIKLEQDYVLEKVNEKTDFSY